MIGRALTKLGLLASFVIGGRSRRPDPRPRLSHFQILAALRAGGCSFRGERDSSRSRYH